MAATGRDRVQIYTVLAVSDGPWPCQMICYICEFSTMKHHHAKITLKIDTCFAILGANWVPYSLCSHMWPFMGHVMIS